MHQTQFSVVSISEKTGMSELDNLKAALALHFAWYNFGRIHGSLRVTPAMEVGITGHIWTMEELLN